MRLIIVPPLTDAYFFLNQAKGLPGIASAETLRSRYLTSCIFLSWVAVEAALDHRLRELQRAGQVSRDRPRLLSAALALVLASSGGRLDEQNFKRLRRVRNDITHPKAEDDDVNVTLAMATDTFQFCASVIEDLYRPFQILYSDPRDQR